MGRIRPFEEGDVPAVAALRRTLFKTTTRTSPGALEDYLRRIFLLNPFRDPEIQSVVYDVDGKARAFIGVIPRPMVFAGEPIRVAVSTQFAVAPELRGLVTIQMVRSVFGGCQDLTLADAGPGPMRKLWVALGGVSVWPHSMMWEARVLPKTAILHDLGESVPARLARVSLRPFARVLDRRLIEPDAAVTSEPVDTVGLVAAAATVLKATLRPAYQALHLDWVIAAAGEKQDGGPIRARLVRMASGEIAGWFVYRAPAGGTGFVLQIGAEPVHEILVLKALLHDARGQKVFSLQGAVDPMLLSAYETVGWPAVRRGPWVLAQSRRPEILAAINRGEAWLSGLDGERWLSF